MDTEISIIDTKIRNVLSFIETGSINNIASITERLFALESEKNTFEYNKNNLETSLLSLIDKQEAILNHTELANRIISQLKNDSDINLYQLRLQLSTTLKRSISKIFMYPGGPWINEAKQSLLKSDLKKSGFTATQINKYLNSLSEPRRDERYFVVLMHDNTFVKVTKNSIQENFTDESLRSILNK
jgi:hypothetical protein